MDDNKSKMVFAPYYESPENTPFTVKISGTTYEVSTHFNLDGKENVLEQFMELLKIA